MASLEKMDHYNSFVQDQMTPGQFASAEFLALAMGPPLLTDVTTSNGTGTPVAFPLGIVQNFSLTQNMVVARIFEIGSKRSYMFPGKVVGAVSFGRPYYHGPSLLRLMMAYYTFEDEKDGAKNLLSVFKNLHKVHLSPGYKNIMVNLASDLFTQPHGELVVMKNTDAEILGAFYLEQCYIPGHSLSVDAQGIIWQEGVQVQFERLVPIDVSNAVDVPETNWDRPKSLGDLTSGVADKFIISSATGARTA